jgi:hypothetical protein
MGWMGIRRSPDYSRLTVDNILNIQSSRIVGVDITLLKGSNVEYMLANPSSFSSHHWTLVMSQCLLCGEEPITVLTSPIAYFSVFCDFVTKPVVLPGELFRAAMSAYKESWRFRSMRMCLHVRLERVLALEATRATRYATSKALSLVVFSRGFTASGKGTV